jgi:hypothetical protein
VSGDWGDFRNWSPQIVPPASADVVVNTGAVDAGARQLVLNSLTANGTVTNVAQLDTPTLTVGGILVATLVNADTFNFSGGSVTGNIRIASGGTWTGGALWTGPVEIQSDAVVSLTAGSVRLGSNVILENHGTVEMTGGQLEGYEISTVRNHGTWILNGHATPFTSFYGGNEFHNMGLLHKTGGADPTSLANLWAFHLDAETRCTTGELRLAAANTYLSTGSQLTGSGTIRSTSTLNLTGNAVETVARLMVDGGTVVCTGEASITGSCEWLAGDVQGLLKVPAGSSMIASGEGFKRLVTLAEIQVAGTWRWDGPGPVQGYDRSKITILAGGLCDLTADGDVFSQFYGGNQLVIEGTLGKSAGAGGTTLLNDWTYVHRGLIECAVSAMEIGSELVLDGQSEIDGAGEVRISATTYHNGTATMNAPVSWTNGSWVGGGGVLNGLLVWSGGSTSGTWEVGASGTLRIIDGTGVLKRFNDAALLAVDGTVELLSGSINGYENATLRVLNGGVVRCAGVAVLDNFYGGNRIEILAGGLLTSQPGCDTRVDWAMDNSGTLTTPAGILKCNGGGQSHGLFHSTSSGSLRFTGGSHVLGAGAEIRGPGEVLVTWGLLDAQAPVPCFIHVNGGTVQGSGEQGEFQFRNGSQWTSGNVGGKSRVLEGALLTVSGDTGLRRMNTDASLLIGGRLLWLGSGEINLYERCSMGILPSGILDIAGNGSVFSAFYGGHLIQNSGIIRRSVSVADALFSNAAFESDGRIEVLTGSLQVASNLGLQDGGVISGAGRLRIVGGTTSLTGTTTVANSIIELAGGTLHAETDSNGTLAGNLIEWSAGYISGDVTWSGIARTATAGFRQINGNSRLRNSGVLGLQGGGSIRMWENAILHNRQGATLHATGQVSITQFYGGNLVLNEGTMVLGASPGRMEVAPAFTQSATGRLEVGVAGPSSGNPDFDILNVSGAASLAGTLVAALENGYHPALGTEFEILKANPRVGTFDQLLASSFSVTYPTTGNPPVSRNNVVLVVQNPTSQDYASWAASHQLSGAEAATIADPDGDGRLNWVEYAFQTDPCSGDGDPLVMSTETMGGLPWLVVRYRRWQGPLDAGIGYLPEGSEDLATWSSVPVVDEFDPDATVIVGAEARRCRIPIQGPRQFMRLGLEWQ